MMQNERFNQDIPNSRDPSSGNYLFQQFNAVMTNYVSPPQNETTQGNNSTLAKETKDHKNKIIRGIYNNPKQKLQCLAIIASGNNPTLAKDLLCLMQGRGMADPGNHQRYRKNYEIYDIIADVNLKDAKEKTPEQVVINGKCFSIDDLKKRPATADPVLRRNSDGSITLIGFNDYTWEDRTYAPQQLRDVPNVDADFLLGFAISNESLEQIYGKGIYGRDLTESLIIWGLPSPSMKGVNYKYDAKAMFVFGQHGSHIIPFYLHSLEKDYKALRKRIEKYPEDFKIWWQSLYDKDSETLSEQLQNLFKLNDHDHELDESETLSQPLQNLFKLNYHELDEIAYKLDSDKVFFPKFSDSALLALGLCANEPVPTQEADKKEKTAYQQIYKAEFYFNSIRYPKKLDDREKFLYCQFFYQKSVNHEASRQDKLDALKRILHCLPDNTNGENSQIPTYKIQELSEKLVKKLYPNNSAPTSKEEIKIKVANQLTALQAIKTADVSTTENKWGARLKQLFVRLLYNIGFVNWRFTLDSNTTISSASRQSRHFSRGESTFFSKHAPPPNEITPLPTENNAAHQQMTNIIQ